MKKKNLLSGSVFKSLWMISLPIILANTLQTLYQLIDTFWVGRLGESAVASVSLVFPILFFLASLAVGFAMAGSILVAQFNGKKDYEKVSFVAGQTLTLVFSLSVLIAGGGYLGAPFLISLLTQDPEVFSSAVGYLQISFLGIPAIFLYMIFQSTLRGVGEVKLPMMIILGTVFLNFVLDPLFMFGYGFIPPMGVLGVAWVTLITEYLSAFIGLLVLFKGRYGVKISLPSLRLKKEWLGKIFRLGFPSSIEHSSRSLGMLLMTFLVSSLGTTVVATYGIGTRILSFVIIPAVGFSVATSALVGNNLGAGQKERSQKIVKMGLKIAFFSLLGVGGILFLGAPSIAHFFVPGEPLLAQNAALFIRIMAGTFGFMGIQMVIIGTLKAAGQTLTAMSLALFHTTVLLLGAFIFSKGLGFEEIGVWWAYPTANVLAVILAWGIYKRKKWLHKKLV